MKPSEIRTALHRMESGECRSIGPRGVTVYCHAPLVETPPDDRGRRGWMRGPRLYRTHFPGLFDYSAAELFADPAPWFDEEKTVRQVLEACAAPIPGPEWKSRWKSADHMARYPVAGAPAVVSQPEPASQPVTIAFPQPTSQPEQRRLFA